MVPLPEGALGFTTPYKSLLYHYNTALDEYQKGNIASAKIFLEMLLEKEPNYPNGLCLLGIILNELGRPNDALLLLDKAYSISKDEKFFNNIELIKKFPGKKINVTVINK